MTQMQIAQSGKTSDEMEQVARAEGVPVELVRAGLAAGTIVIPKNKGRIFEARGVGEGLSTKINANIGTSEKGSSLAEELAKLDIAVQYGADSVMDLSTGAGLLDTLRAVLDRSPVMVGTVPMYAVSSRMRDDERDPASMSVDELFDAIEEQARMGVDFVTVHCGITRRSVEFYESMSREGGVTSRGGALIKRWMKLTGNENPLYEYYDRLLDIAVTYDVTLSLGDGLRPGGQCDATDSGQLAELMVLAECVRRARARGVQVMVEGPGHVPLDQVAMNVRLQKRLCAGAPFYVLGPLVTDIAPGYDHIVGAIGGTLAAAEGADFLCYVTPAEHLTLPDNDDVRQGVIASKIAAHAADIVKKVPGAAERDRKMTIARRCFKWEDMYKLALDPELARSRKQSSASADEEYCSMCGRLCAVRTDRGE